MILHQSWIFLFTILVLTVGAGLLTVHFKDTGLFEGLTPGPTYNNTTPPNIFKIVFSIPYNATIAVIDINDKVVDFNNNIIGNIRTIPVGTGPVPDGYVQVGPNNDRPFFIDNFNNKIYTNQYVVDENGILIGVVINSDDRYPINRPVTDEYKNNLGLFTVTSGQKVLWNGRIVGTFNNDGSLTDNQGKIIGFSLRGTIKTPKMSLPFSPIPTQTSPFSYFNGDLGNMGGDENNDDFDILRGRLNDYYPPPDGDITIINNDRNNLRMQNGLYKDRDNISSFNYDLLYDTDNLSPKYSFTNSSFLYKSYLTDENDYLNEVYFNKNPLELEKMCKGLDNTTCGLTSTCVFVGNDKCLPGNKRGPYTVYSDINLDYYYYKGKCYGNCPGKFYPGGGDDGDVNKTPKKTTARQSPPNNTTAIHSQPTNTTSMPSSPNNTTTRQ